MNPDTENTRSQSKGSVMSTGLPGLDRVLTGLRPGDNVVWEVDGIQDYLPVLGPLCGEASRLRRKLIYDTKKNEFVGDAEANRLRSEAIREPWRL